jgi:hypothetical protein
MTSKSRGKNNGRSKGKSEPQEQKAKANRRSFDFALRASLDDTFEDTRV